MTKFANTTEKLIAFLVLGIVEAISKEKFSTDDSENLVFLPKYLEELKKLKTDVNLVSLVQLGTELNDIETMVPWTLSKTLEKMKMLALCVIEKKGQVMQLGEWFDEIRLLTGSDLKFKSRIENM
jgi:MoaA/NifB/PqqE/SkfB family radical SAM enzyme